MFCSKSPTVYSYSVMTPDRDGRALKSTLTVTPVRRTRYLHSPCAETPTQTEGYRHSTPLAGMKGLNESYDSSLYKSDRDETTGMPKRIHNIPVSTNFNKPVKLPDRTFWRQLEYRHAVPVLKRVLNVSLKWRSFACFTSRSPSKQMMTVLTSEGLFLYEGSQVLRGYALPLSGLSQICVQGADKLSKKDGEDRKKKKDEVGNKRKSPDIEAFRGEQLVQLDWDFGTVYLTLPAELKMEWGVQLVSAFSGEH